MAFVKLVKNIFALSLVCVGISQIKGNRLGADEELSATSDTHIIYDQRQSGKYNIHVVIKDVAIIEMDQNEVADQNYNDDEEYYYDDDDLTIKPINIKTTTPTNRPSSTTATTINPIKTTSFTTEYSYSLPTSPNTETPTFINNEMTTQTGSLLWNTVIPTTISTEKPSNDVVLSSKSQTKVPAIDIKPRSKIEPIYAIKEPILHPIRDSNYGMSPQAQSRADSLPIEVKTNTLTNSKIYKVKVHRSHQPPNLLAMKIQARRCRSYQYRDSRGNCRVKRSSLSSGSILKRLFSMLVKLPFVRGEQHNAN